MTASLYAAGGNLTAAAALASLGAPSSSSSAYPSTGAVAAAAATAPPPPKARPSHHAPIESLIRDKPSQRALAELCLQLRRGQLKGAENVATATAKLLRSVASAAKFTSLQQLIDILKAAGRALQASQPREQTIGNITRRVVHLLREEARIAINEAHEGNPPGPSAAIASPQSLTRSLTGLTLSPTAQAPQPIGFPSSSPLVSPGTVPSIAAATPPAGNTVSSRPGPSPLRNDSAFVHGSFSISDLVAAGAMATPALATPADSSYASTPHGPLSRSGSGFFNQHSLHVQGGSHISQFSVTEDPDGEAMAEAQDNDDDDDDEDDDDDVEASDVDGSHGASHDSDSESEADVSRSTGQLHHKSSSMTATATTTANKKSDMGAYWLKPLVVQAIQEMLLELEEADENIAKDARDHIHSGEVILTLGYSKTTEAFFKAAAKDRKFTVIVAETAPLYTGHTLARSLSSAKISTLLIPDSNIFAVMPRVSKVVLGGHAILANGGLLTSPGALPISLAARSHSTPIVVLAATYKISPEWETIDDFISHRDGGSPDAILDFSTLPNVVECAEVVNPQWDYIAPELVDVFITNVGEHPSSYIYRLVKENYDGADVVL
ncbi:uncharacterized protein PFL1_01126 [Pseudozyma flocculosa PF-1]|uniref:Translation initiation factor eIF2B subunit beta n=1 Tax=Pseudozyma flocculosa TaxID=84751 RepID=A0A5C3FCE2_9BASI|nr:uncharacterized protein PFL1_01126 [Pseudozyma flocculosa PF-1]EPQ31794.1 hypothetical protein PFL1_01126 [Pseudozyma flocculosa PF-1]SPO41816.1 related to GCD7 - translation initiation factor eIF2b, 43 kDa subunit [Pseudozyma flocculosa]